MQDEKPGAVRRRLWIGGGGMGIGLLLVILSLVPFMRTEQNGPLVLGDYEIFIVIGLVFFNLGLLVLLQEWFGLV
ncbi:MAG TPA: hypothetical protein VFE37_02705 [Chloroflexota bacterium]|nr:hypothetical protein [Chloroflexota bacterium]